MSFNEFDISPPTPYGINKNHKGVVYFGISGKNFQVTEKRAQEIVNKLCTLFNIKPEINK